MTLTVSIGGLGAIGLAVARAPDRGIDGLRLIALRARDRDRAPRSVAHFPMPPEGVGTAELARAGQDIGSNGI